MLTLNNIRSPRGANKNEKRLGRGQASGQGTQAGKGHKGQKARKSGHTRIGFIGGGMPLYMRLPKRGFTNAPFKTIYAEVNLSQVNLVFDKAALVTRESLIEKKLIKGADRGRPIKILGKGKLEKALTFSGIEKFSESATKAIQGAGGKIEELSKK